MVILYEWMFVFITAISTILLHDFALKKGAQLKRPLPMVLIMILLTASHSLHIWLYAFVYYITDKWLALGELFNCNCEDIFDYVYFSAANYTSLGYGDIIASEGIRILATSEGLVGLLMIGWSTAYAFWWMQKHWLNIEEKGKEND